MNLIRRPLVIHIDQKWVTQAVGSYMMTGTVHTGRIVRHVEKEKNKQEVVTQAI